MVDEDVLANPAFGVGSTHVMFRSQATTLAALQPSIWDCILFALRPASTSILLVGITGTFKFIRLVRKIPWDDISGL